MAHDKVFGIRENKCKVPVMPIIGVIELKATYFNGLSSLDEEDTFEIDEITVNTTPFNVSKFGNMGECEITMKDGESPIDFNQVYMFGKTNQRLSNDDYLIFSLDFSNSKENPERTYKDTFTIFFYLA